MAESAKVTVPYLPFKTFISILESMSKFLPDQVHTSMWPSYSGAVKSQAMATLKFLKLITEDGTPTKPLTDIAGSESKYWPNYMKDVLANSYVDLMSCDLTKATPGSFDAEMRKFGQEGDTHRKAASFFLQAAKYAGVPLSPLLLKNGRLSSTRRKKSNGPKKGIPQGTKATADSSNGQQIRPTEPSGIRKDIFLDNESVLTVMLDKNFGELPSKQRKFVNQLLDLMEDFVESEIEGEEEEDTRD